MANFKKLYEKREQFRNEIKQIIAGANTENRALSNEEKTRFDDMERQIADIDATLDREERARKLCEAYPADDTEEKKQTPEERAEAEEKAFADFVGGAATENRADAIQLTQGVNGAIVPQTIANRIYWLFGIWFRFFPFRTW